MTNKLKLCLLLSTALVSASSFATGENCTRDHSYAYCVLDLAGLSLGAREVSAEEIEKYIDVNKLASNGGVDKLDVVINGIGIAKARNLFELNLIGAISVLSLIGDNRALGEKPQLFAILPESVVQDGDPKKTAEIALIEGVVKTLGAESYSAIDVEKSPTFGRRYVLRNYKIVGGQCGDEGCIAYANFFQSSTTEPEVLDKTPKWFSGERSYVWSGYVRNAWPNVRRNGDKKWMFPPSEMVALTQNLPSWFYYYFPGKAPFILTSEKLDFLSKR